MKALLTNFLWILLVCGVALLGTIAAGPFWEWLHPVSDPLVKEQATQTEHLELITQTTPQPPKTIPETGKTESKNTPDFKSQESEMFSFLRDVELLGTHCTVLRHNPTAQRIVLLSGTPGQDEAYRLVFAQKLSKSTFAALIPVFKSGSKFEDSDIEVDSVEVGKVTQINYESFKMMIKHYVVQVKVDGTPESFETYIGRVDEADESRGIALTFNTKSYGSLAPFEDLLKQLKPQKPQ